MKETKVFHNDLSPAFRDKLSVIVLNFEGIEGGIGDRNTIKVIDVDGTSVNIKSFKLPNAVNQFAYRFLRKSKAQRSFEFAKSLLDLGIGTPNPLGYFEFTTTTAFKQSFYLSEQQDCDLTYRELIHDLQYPDHENILRAFTRFTYELHEKNVLFLDHSPGNTLIKKKGDSYEFFLVDLNRMKFEPLDVETRIKNFARLTPLESMVRVMSDEYAKCIGKDFEYVFERMWSETQIFRYKFQRKKRLKSKLKFWK